MPSILDLYGELGLKTDQFDNKLKGSVGQMQAADAQLNKVIATSNKLGDTSATVARRYEKLSEGIAAQKQKLIEHATAFQKDEISAAQFEKRIASVDKTVASLTSRIKDAQARTVELNETGLTHFQNQIQGAVDKSHSLINLGGARPLQGLGPILQGLGARQFGIDETILNILIVAAREAGILKVAQEGTAVATTAAAAAETEFVAASRAAAASQAIVAAETEATAAAATQATTIFGVGLGTIGAIGAIAAIIAGDALLIYERTKAIEAEGEKRLKQEEAIAAAINEQANAAARLQQRLAAEQDERNFSQYLQSNNLFDLQFTRESLQRQHDQAAREIADKKIAVSADLDRRGIKPGDYYTQELAKIVPPGFADKQKRLEDEISKLSARIDELKQSSFESSSDFIKRVQGNQIDIFNKNQKDAQEEAKKRAKELAEEVKRELKETSDLIYSIGAKSDNPYVKLFTDAERQIERVREATKLLSADIRNSLIAQTNQQTQVARYGLELSGRLQAYNLRADAANFLGKRPNSEQYVPFDKPLTASQKLQGELQAILGTTISSRIVGYASGGGLGGHASDLGGVSPILKSFATVGDLPKDEALKAVAERQIIELTKGVKPEDLTKDQRQLAARAREDEAKRVLAQEKNAIKQTEILNQLLNKLNEGGALVTIKNESDRAKVTTRPTSAAVESYYQNQ